MMIVTPYLALVLVSERRAAQGASPLPGKQALAACRARRRLPTLAREGSQPVLLSKRG